jgi:hypothetical protein
LRRIHRRSNRCRAVPPLGGYNRLMRILRLLAVIAVFGLALGFGAVAGYRLLGKRARLPDTPAMVEQMREVARLETLEVALHKKVSFVPDPAPVEGIWRELFEWARYSIRAAEGRAIVFADVQLGLDLERMGPDSVFTVGRTAYVVLPPIRAQVLLRPGETEIIGSNLDSAETAQLFEMARTAFEAEVSADRKLQQRARASAERAIRALLVTLGFEEVHFVDVLPRPDQG